MAAREMDTLTKNFNDFLLWFSDFAKPLSIPACVGNIGEYIDSVNGYSNASRDFFTLSAPCPYKKEILKDYSGKTMGFCQYDTLLSQGILFSVLAQESKDCHIVFHMKSADKSSKLYVQPVFYAKNMDLVANFIRSNEQNQTTFEELETNDDAPRGVGFKRL